MTPRYPRFLTTMAGSYGRAGLDQSRHRRRVVEHLGGPGTRRWRLPYRRAVAEPPRRKQHLVSRGYQANFASAGMVTVLDVRTGRVVERSRSIRRNWRVDDFLSVVSAAGVIDDSLEREFGRRERVFLNAVRRLEPFKPLTDEQKRSLDALVATHLARSGSFAAAHGRVAQGAAQSSVPRLALDDRVVRSFHRERGRAPEPGELEGIIAASARAFLSDPRLLSSGIKRVSAGIEDLLAPLHVQLVALDSHLPGFALADMPVLHGRRTEGIFGFGAPVAVGDADIIVVPVMRRLAAFYTADPLPDVCVKTKNAWCWINALFLHGAAAEVACHPDDALDVARLIRDVDRYPPGRFDSVTIR